jgi:GNAT superfamily N-acetyltransferase
VIHIRPVRETDLASVTAMVHELAAYERAADECELTVEHLRTALFAPRPAVFAHVAELPGEPEPVGFSLWFRNFSTWRGVHGIYLEDLYVRPVARDAGVGRAMLAALAALCVAHGYGRLDWWVLHWNPAREFYHAIGARPMDEWVPYRLSGPALDALANLAPAAFAETVQSYPGGAM